MCDSSTRLDINGIKAHPFFDGMAWDDPSDPCWTPCWVPELRDGDLVSAGSHWLPPHSCHAPCRSPRTAAPQKGFCGSVGSSMVNCLVVTRTAPRCAYCRIQATLMNSQRSPAPGAPCVPLLRMRRYAPALPCVLHARIGSLVSKLGVSRCSSPHSQASTAFKGYTFNRPPTMHGGSGAGGGASSRKATTSRPTMGAAFFTPPS